MITAKKTCPGRTRILTTTSDFDKQVARAIVAALKNGLSEARGLENAGLLLTPAKQVELVATGLRNIADLLDATRVQDILPDGVPGSAGDMKRWTAQWLRGIADDNEARPAAR